MRLKPTSRASSKHRLLWAANGIKVIDLTSMVSGPVAAMMLGDQGAGSRQSGALAGEQLRHLGEPHNGLPSTFYSCNATKNLWHLI